MPAGSDFTRPVYVSDPIETGKTMRVLTTDAASRIALSVLRSLGRRGFRVDVMGTAHSAPGFHSRFCRGRILHDRPERDFEAYARLLQRTVAGAIYDVLLPILDGAVLAASRRADDLSRQVGLAVPSQEALAVSRDKARTLTVAQELGIEVPRTFVPSDAGELSDIASCVSYPCVIKLRQGAGALGLQYADSPADLQAKYNGGAAASDTGHDHAWPLVQEYVPGQTCDVCVLFDCGEPAAVLTQRRLKTWPVSGGRGVLDETTDEPLVAETAVRLLRHLRWHGPAQVEFKMDARTGRPVLMEVNGRLWGGLALSVEAGVDFPYLTCLLATGKPLPPAPRYPVGLRYAWMMPMGLAHLLVGPDRLRAAAAFAREAAAGRCDVELSDPLPALAALVHAQGSWRTVRHKGPS